MRRNANFFKFIFHGSTVLIPNFCSLGEMGHFSYVAFDHRMNKQRIQNKKHNGGGNENIK